MSQFTSQLITGEQSIAQRVRELVIIVTVFLDDGNGLERFARNNSREQSGATGVDMLLDVEIAEAGLASASAPARTRRGSYAERPSPG